MPLNDPESAVKEAERAIKDLRLRGVEIGTDLYGKAIDGPEFMPLYEKMEELDRPIFIHPLGEISTPDYKGEKASKYRLWTKIGWPCATAMAVCRLVYSGVFDRYPKLKVVTHHCGGFIPYLAARFDWADDFNETTAGQRDIDLKEKGLTYFKRNVYYDTAISGNTGALNCARDVVGLGQMLFGTDAPFDNQFGRRLIRQTIESVERMDLTEGEKKQIYRDNAINLLRLPLGVF
jgi:aminocarboxymuconate-semialdehyde decarboxylase